MMHKDVDATWCMEHPDKVKEMQEMGIEVTPVDFQGAYVPLDKHHDPEGEDNIIETQENIRRKFQLGGE